MNFSLGTASPFEPERERDGHQRFRRHPALRRLIRTLSKEDPSHFAASQLFPCRSVHGADIPNFGEPSIHTAVPVTINLGISILQTPEHWCSVPELAHLSVDDRRNLSIPLEERDGMLVYSRCTVYDVNFTEVITSNLVVANFSAYVVITSFREFIKMITRCIVY